jgi:hypothetical protein
MKTQKVLLALFLILFGFGINGAFAQTSTTSPDTVCAGTLGKAYKVTNTPGSTYYWVVKGGTQASGGNTNAITINWSTTPGTDTLKVVEKNSHGCFGDTVKLAVYRMPLPTATISGLDSVCYNYGSTFQVAFTGVGPWNFTYSDGTTSTSLTNISTNPYTVSTGNLTGTKTYTVTAVSNKFGCTGTASGSATIVVRPKPVTSAIFH